MSLVKIDGREAGTKMQVGDEVPLRRERLIIEKVVCGMAWLIYVT